MRLAVKLVGAATGHHIENRAGCVPLRGVVDIGLHLHFLDRLIRESDCDLCVRAGVFSPTPRCPDRIVRDAIHREVVSGLAYAVRADERQPLREGCFSWAQRGRVCHARRKHNQLGSRSILNGKLLELRPVDHRASTPIGRFQKRRLRGDQNLIGGRAYLERYFQLQRIGDAQLEAGADIVLESHHLNLHGVLAGQQIRHSEIPAHVRGYFGGNVRSDVGNLNRRFRDRPSACVGNCSDNGASRFLTAGNARYHHANACKQRHGNDCSSSHASISCSEALLFVGPCLFVRPSI